MVDQAADHPELRREIFTPFTALYSEKFRLGKLNTKFGCSRINETEFEKLVEQEGLEAVVEHHTQFFGKVVTDSRH